MSDTNTPPPPYSSGYAGGRRVSPDPNYMYVTSPSPADATPTPPMLHTTNMVDAKPRYIAMVDHHPHVTQIVYVPRQPLANPPKDYLMFNIVATIFCLCWPVGIFAILKSLETKDAVMRGDEASALRDSALARKLGLATLVLGSIFTLLGIVVIVVATVALK
jgi:hypothetical protein